MLEPATSAAWCGRLRAPRRPQPPHQTSAIRLPLLQRDASCDRRCGAGGGRVPRPPPQLCPSRCARCSPLRRQYRRGVSHPRRQPRARAQARRCARPDSLRRYARADLFAAAERDYAEPARGGRDDGGGSAAAPRDRSTARLSRSTPAGRAIAFQELMRRFGRTRDIERLRAEQPVRLFLFDLMRLDGNWLIDVPYADRYVALSELAEEAGLELAGRILPASVGRGRAILCARDRRGLRRRHGEGDSTVATRRACAVADGSKSRRRGRSTW